MSKDAEHLINVQPDEEALFHKARRIAPGTDRDAFLDQACGELAGLRGRVEALLRVHEEEANYLNIPTLAMVALPGSAECPGTVIGPYRLMESIGEGGMGVVYVAEQTAPVRRRVALKVIKPGMDSRQVIARFEAERQALALMDHPNIARVLDGGTTQSGRPYFVMELIRGVPITDYCDREQLSIAERLDLFVLVCRAVQHAHQKGIIHRDLKPSNILITVIDGTAVPKVIDFGVAKAVGVSLTEKSVYTAFHQMVGTPLYMSPEQANLAGVDVDTRSDIYSLGVLLYELLTGTTPFDSETLRKAAFDEVRRIIREEDPPRPSTRLSTPNAATSAASARRKVDPKSLGRSMRGELDWIVMKSLEKDRKQRYETANDFAADVMNYLADRPVTARPPSAGYRFAKHARRNRALLTTGALVALALVAGTAASTWQAIRATGAERRAEIQQARAEKQTRQARNAVDEMYTQFAEKWLARQPKMTQVQTEFLDKALRFYESFAADQGNDPEAQFESARARRRIGSIQRGLGKFDRAASAFRESITQFESLAARFPARPEYSSELAITCIDLAELEMKLDRQGEAEPLLNRSVAMLESLVAREPKDRLNRIRLATGLRELGALRLDRERISEAISFLLRGVAIFEELQAEGPLPAEGRHQHAACVNNLGIVYDRMKQLDRAEMCYRNEIELTEAWLKDEPADPRARYALAIAYNNIALVQNAAGRREEVRASEARSIALLETLAAEFPQLLAYRGTLLRSRANWLHSLLADEKTREAEPEIRRALDDAEALVRDHPDVPDYRWDLYRILSLAADLHAASPSGPYHDPEKAEKLARRASEMKPRDAEIPQALTWTRYRAGDWKGCLEILNQLNGGARNNSFFGAMSLWKLGDFALARAIFVLSDLSFLSYERNWAPGIYPPPSIQRGFRIEAAALLGIKDEPRGDPLERALLGAQAEPERLAAELPGHPELRGMMIPLCYEIGQRLRNLNRHREAVRYFEIALKHARVISAAHPDHVGYRQTLLDCCSRLTSEYSTFAAPKDRNPERALELAREAVALKEDDTNTWENLGWALYRVGDWKGCIEALEKSIELEKKGTGWDWFFLAMAYHQLGDRARARDEYNRAVAWQKDQPIDPRNRTRLINIREEAAALLGLEPTATNASNKPGDAPPPSPK